MGYRRGLGGYLRKETEEEKKNGNGNGNGHSNSNGSNGNGAGNGNGGSSSNGGGNGSGGMSEAYDTKKIKKIVKQLRKSTKTHKAQADYLEKVSEESNPRIPRKKGQPATSIIPLIASCPFSMSEYKLPLV